MFGFKNSKGYSVPRHQVRADAIKHATTVGAKLIQITRSALGGKWDIGKFIGKFADIIKTSVIQMSVLGRAGKIDLKSIAKQTIDRVKQIHSFAHELLAGKLSLPQALARARQFGTHILQVFSEGEKATAIANGNNLAMRRLSPGYAHCQQCIEYATYPQYISISGIVPTGVNCDCGGNCKCTVIYKSMGNIDATKVSNNVEPLVQSSQASSIAQQMAADKKMGKYYEGEERTIGGWLKELNRQTEMTREARSRRIEIAKRLRASIVDGGMSKKEAINLVGKVEFDPNIPKSMQRNVKNHAIEFMQISCGGGSDVLSKFTFIDNRAHIHIGTGTINIGDANKSTIFHEMGHAAECAGRIKNQKFAKHPSFRYEPEVDYLSKHTEWVKQRATGELQELSKITGNLAYGVNEKALPDNFISPYVGKIYPHATEVLSMGIESFSDHRAMLRLWETDREHFNLVIDYIQERQYVYSENL